MNAGQLGPIRGSGGGEDVRDPAPLLGVLGSPLLIPDHGGGGGKTPVTQLPIVGEVLSRHLDAVLGPGPHGPEGEGCGFNGPHLRAKRGPGQREAGGWGRLGGAGVHRTARPSLASPAPIRKARPVHPPPRCWPFPILAPKPPCQDSFGDLTPPRLSQQSGPPQPTPPPGLNPSLWLPPGPTGLTWF